MQLTFFSLFVITLMACSPSRLAQKDNWEILFNGADVSKLKGYQMAHFPSSAWEVKDDALKTKTGVANVDLLTKSEYKNFELSFEWKTSVGGNSGVFFHIREDEKQEAGNGNSPNWLTNYEMQLLDDVNFYDKEPKRSAGALYDLITPQNKTLLPVGEYNTSRLVVQDDKVEHWLNGNKVVAYKMDSPELNNLISRSKFKDIPSFGKSRNGHIAFQHHGQEFWFRNIKIRKL